MWLGVAAGLALLTWFTIFPAVFAAQITLNDQQLTYDGSGWQDTQSPQICQQVSTTMRSTSMLGDSVNFAFLGSGVIVWGPVTSDSLPVVVVLDGVVQPLAAPQECTGGCGIIYTNGGLADASHNITVLFPQANGTTTLSICGITIIADFPQFIQPPAMTTGIKATPTTTVSSTSLTTPDPSPPPVAITAFVTTPGMIIAIIGAIAGVIVVMAVLLYIFITVRRRITRHAARSRDRENSFDREARDQEPKRSFSIQSSVFSNDSKSNVTGALVQSECSRIRASIAVSTASTHSRFSIHVASGLGFNQRQSSRMPSVYTERSADLVFMGLAPGTPTESDNVYIYSSQTEENPLVTNRSSTTTSGLSIPITLFSPARRLSSTTLTTHSISAASFTPRISHISDASGSTSSPRASRIRIFPRTKFTLSENDHGNGSTAGSSSPRTHHIRNTPVRLSYII